MPKAEPVEVRLRRRLTNTDQPDATQRAIANAFGVDATTISRIVRNERRTG